MERQGIEQLERTGNFLTRTESGLGRNEVDRRVVTLTAPASGAAEEYRALYFRLEALRTQRPLKIVAVTSSSAGEGKTITAVNLALTAAAMCPERRVLLVDADLRRGQVADRLGMKSRPGLAELLAGECSPSEAVRRFVSVRLAVIPAGGSPEDAARLVASERMVRFLDAMRSGFDEIYVDLPPVLPYADASILGRRMDGVMLVVRARQSRGWHVQEAVDRLAGSPLLGCVLNGADMGELYDIPRRP